jgi:hypothetical protein
VDDHPRDALAVVAVAVVAVAALVSGLRTGWSRVDVDERVYVQTLREMRAGASYYDAMRDALVTKEGAPPRSVRAIRPPTMFLLLRPFPEVAWRWLAGASIAVSLWLLWRLGRPYGPYGGVAAVVLGGLWLLGAAPLLFLHAELWGLPFALAGLVLARRSRPVGAVAALVVAVAFRELYVVFVVAAAAWARRRRAWVVGIVVVAALAGVHAAFARGVLSSAGHQVALGNEPHDLSLALRVLSPGDTTAGGVLGAVVLGVGAVGLARRWPSDAVARIVATSSVVLLVAAFVETRVYWTLAFAPAVASFVPAAFVRWSRGDDARAIDAVANVDQPLPTTHNTTRHE